MKDALELYFSDYLAGVDKQELKSWYNRVVNLKKYINIIYLNYIIYS
jgi:hypothetical protein